MNLYNNKTSNFIIHILIWIIIFAISASEIYLKIGIIPNDFYFKFSIFLLVFYVNYHLLVPRIFLKKKFLIYIITVLIFSFLFIFLLEYFVPEPLNLPENLNREFPRHFPKPRNNNFFLKFLPTLIVFLLLIALSTSIKLGIEWYRTEKERVLIASQKVNSELSFLKAQLNPHFLFNTLNSIYALANKKSENTSVAIVTLSELMRYMIYEANEKNVSLEKEIEHIKNYISLQLLRLKDSSGVRVNIHGNLNYKIEPLLLISFIENAFKYGTDFNGKTDIRIKITIREKVLNLFVYNTSSNQESKKENSGIGLENIKNRLNLLYPNSHTLDIISDVKSYSVNLTIKLKN